MGWWHTSSLHCSITIQPVSAPSGIHTDVQCDTDCFPDFIRQILQCDTQLNRETDTSRHRMCVCLSSFIPDEGVFTGATSDSLMARFHLNNLPFVPSFLLLKILYILMRSLHDFLPALPLTSWPVHELCSYEKRPGLCLPNVFLFFSFLDMQNHPEFDQNRLCGPGQLPRCQRFA